MFSLAKEFGWTPSQMKKEDNKDMTALVHILSVFNNVQNKEMEKITRKNRR